MDSVPRSALGSPSNVYLGIVTNPELAKTSYEALKSTGLSNESIMIYSGPEDKEAFVDAGFQIGESSDFNKGVRQIFAADEVAREAHYRDAIDKGQFVIQIEVDSDNETKRSEVESILNDNHIEDITYFGPRSFETVASE